MVVRYAERVKRKKTTRSRLLVVDRGFEPLCPA